MSDKNMSSWKHVVQNMTIFDPHQEVFTNQFFVFSNISQFPIWNREAINSHSSNFNLPLQFVLDTDSQAPRIGGREVQNYIIRANTCKGALGAVYTMDHEVVPRPSKRCDWTLKSSRDDLGLHQGKNGKVTTKVEVLKI
jgi:hypothetical protein